MPVQKTAPMMMVKVIGLGAKSAAKMMSRNSVGIEFSVVMNQVMTSSMAPRKYPATSPSSTPMVSWMKAAMNPTNNETCPP